MVDQIIDFTGLGEAIHMPVQFYSSGMTARLAYAVAAHLNPDLLLVDEVMAVGDLDFQRKCIRHMQQYLAEGGSIILVSHVPYHIQAVCGRGLLLEKGRMLFAGTATETLDRYFTRQHEPVTSLTERSSTRLGPDRPVAIGSLTVKTAQGTAAKSGSDVCVTLTCESLTSVNNVGWSFFIWTNDGATCITSAINEVPLTLKAGRNELVCRLPRLPLMAGGYQLKAAVFEIGSMQVLAHLGWEDAPERLLVEEDQVSTMKNMQATVQQLITLDVEWTLAR
ncbi:MAG: hypothetical protein EOO39_12715 [Cytophagaceae bacterium]|nr:MAG: hypothetical protein EOO39_12715 [Cytophagaceae bacterium]